jgi:P-type Ca2+ transporter type 2C
MWFSKSTEDVLKALEVEPRHGLSVEEAVLRLEQYGANILLGRKKKNIFQMFLAQLNEWLIYVLLAAVVITLFMGEYIDAIIITLVIITNAVLGVIQEVKAEKAIEALQKMSFPKAIVRRSGGVLEVPSGEVVPGDILLLDAGRYISADVRLIESVNLQIEESALTGESVATDKDADSLVKDPKTPLGDRVNLAYMSTLVTRGRGVGVVVATGMLTEVGKIATLINRETKPKTPLEVRLDKLGKTLGKFAIAICAIIFVIAAIQGRNLAEMFILSVSLAVAAIPEGLAAIVAVVLSIGVTVMSRKNAVIKKLPAVETLGSVTMICSDKTGTLTQNKMTVTQCFTMGEEFIIERNGVNNVTRDAQFLAEAMVLSSDATFENGQGTGDPTEIALLLLADDLGVDRPALIAGQPRTDEYSFDSDRKLMSTLIDSNGAFTIYTKGAIGNLLKISSHVLHEGVVVPITEAHRVLYHEATEKMSNNALRTLGVAYKPVNGRVEPSEMEHDLIFIGIVGMIDPPRPEAKEAIRQAGIAGIVSIMITGDHKNTAFAIARQLGIAETPDQAITAREMDELSEEEFTKGIERYRVFARVSPEHKVKIVHALQAHGHIVSMTGDGVNDAPSLNAADIGIAMGITGTDVAKGASDMILMDDNFATIVTAIEQGRNIFNNIKKSVVFLLTCNLGEVVAIFVTLVIGLESPLIAVQLLWINLITDSFPAIALGMDPGSGDVMKEQPRNAKDNFFAGGAGLHIMMGGLLIGVLTMLAFWKGYDSYGYSPFDRSAPAQAVEYARTMAFMVLVMCQLFFSLAVRSHTKSIFQIGIFSNKTLIGAIVLGLLLQMIVIAVPFLQLAFHLQPLMIRDWLFVVLIGLIPLLFNEVLKIGIRLRLSKNPKTFKVKNL